MFPVSFRSQNITRTEAIRWKFVAIQSSFWKCDYFFGKSLHSKQVAFSYDFLFVSMAGLLGESVFSFWKWQKKKKKNRWFRTFNRQLRWKCVNFAVISKHACVFFFFAWGFAWTKKVPFETDNRVKCLILATSSTKRKLRGIDCIPFRLETDLSIQVVFVCDYCFQIFYNQDPTLRRKTFVSLKKSLKSRSLWLNLPCTTYSKMM